MGFDFNPTVDKLRVVTGPGRNFRLDPVTGQLVDGNLAVTGTQGDRNLSYEANDPNNSAKPRVTASAYINSRAGATSTELFGIDSARDVLVLQDPPNDGVLNTVGKLRVNAGGAVGFDVAKNGGAYASFAKGGKGATGLYRVNLSNGRATRAASFNSVGGFTRKRGTRIRALATAGRVSDDNLRPRVGNRKLNDPLVSQLLSGRVLRLRITCSEACLVDAQLVLGRTVVGGDDGQVRSRGGRIVLRLDLSRKGARIVRRRKPSVLAVGIAAVDGGGNRVRSSRYQR